MFAQLACVPRPAGAAMTAAHPCCSSTKRSFANDSIAFITRHVAPASTVFSSPALVKTHPTFGVSSCIGPDRTVTTAAGGTVVTAGALSEGVVGLVDAAGTVGPGALHAVKTAETSATIGKDRR